ncbi:nitrite reductase small subunit NirD [Rothia sp. P100]|uniref:nitrite reductase small subunit NirD n=1 Tax=unclassified Rothia (in: high G+C Gram-positive bacteria) TaxID=2689056 RepID=UPI00203FBD7F|nr:nitrite reductase small subunit NirD [Rothia sp. P100]
MITQWHRICAMDELEPNWGEAALLDGRQYAVFRTSSDSIFVTDHKDPASGSLVIARGIVGEKNGESTVTSPLYKEVYSLASGDCLSGGEFSLPVYSVEVRDGDVWVELPA